MIWRERIVTLTAFFLLALLALGSYWLAQRARFGDLLSGKVVRHEIDSFAEGMITHRIGADGQLQARILADRMEHFPDDNTVVLTRHVQIEQMAKKPGETPMQVRTERATLFADAKMIRSDLPVEVTQGNSVITGIGMQMDTAARRVQLQRDVKAHWVQ